MPNKEDWYVVYTCPNSERKIYNELRKRYITAYLPTREVVRQWSDRKKKVETPLFPNYVFVKVPKKNMWSVLMINGVVRFISFNGAPTVVKDAEMNAVKLLSDSFEIINENSCERGEKVRIKQGPLAGLAGRVVSNQGMMRLYIELESIQKTISVNVGVYQLEKLH